MSDVKAKIGDVEEYMKSLGSNLDAIRGLDRDIEALAAENRRMAAENERIEALIEKCRKEIDHYRFEDPGSVSSWTRLSERRRSTTARQRDDPSLLFPPSRARRPRVRTTGERPGLRQTDIDGKLRCISCKRS